MEKTPEEREENKRHLKRILESDARWEAEFAQGERAVLQRRGFNHWEREDILLDTRGDAWQNLHAGKYNGDSRPQYYLHGIARRHAADVISENEKDRRTNVSVDEPIGNADGKPLTRGETLADPRAVSIEEEVASQIMDAKWCAGLDEIQDRIKTEVGNKKHRFVLGFLMDVEKQIKYQGEVYAAIAREAEQFGIDLPLNQVPVNVQRAKPEGYKIIHAVTEEQELGERFRYTALGMLDLRNGRMQDNDDE
jgi:hypothetical protein